MFLVLCVSLLASWVLALVQVPVCAKEWLPVRMSRKNQIDNTRLPYNSRIHQYIRRIINTLIEHKVATLSIAIILLALSGMGMMHVKNLFFPDFDYAQVVVEYQ